MRVPVPDVLLPADELGRVHFVGIGGAGLSAIARIMLARGMPVSGSDGSRHADPRRAARAGRDRATWATTPTTSRDVDTLVVSTAAPRRQPRGARGPAPGLRILPRSAGQWSVMAGPPRGRGGRHPRQDHDDLAAHLALLVAPAPTRRTPSAACSPRPASNAERRHRRPVRGEADESDGAFLVYRPYAAIVTNVAGRPPRRVGERGGLPAGVRGLRRDRRPATASWSAASTTLAPPRWPTHARGPGSPVVTVGEAGRRRRPRRRA